MKRRTHATVDNAAANPRCFGAPAIPSVHTVDRFPAYFSVGTGRPRPAVHREDKIAAVPRYPFNCQLPPVQVLVRLSFGQDPLCPALVVSIQFG